MDINAIITGIKYTPLLCSKLETVDFNELEAALARRAVFILNIDKKDNIALSWWVTPKRTRSYPYARVYDSLGFSGRKVTIIPVWKDEGKDGESDFIQWDSVSLMSLLGIYVIIAYYVKAKHSTRYDNKITKQEFDISYIKHKIQELKSYHSDALHWNLEQLEKISELEQTALNSYKSISQCLAVEMHPAQNVQQKINKLHGEIKAFMALSRKGAEQAQKRELVTKQPKEKLTREKAAITIRNYLGGYYCFTADEAWMEQDKLYICECKHSARSSPRYFRYQRCVTKNDIIYKFERCSGK